MIVRVWIVYGMVAGILADLAYASAVAPSGLPPQIAIPFGVAFGPLLCLAFVGLYFFFAAYRKTIGLQASAVFGVIAGTLVTMMIVVQAGLRFAIPNESRFGMGLAWDGLNMVQLGLEVSWDIYFAVATILLGIVMRPHPRFGWLWSDVTLLLGAGLLTQSLLTFPLPPTPASVIELGPLAAVWYVVIFLRVLTSLKTADPPVSEPAMA